MDESALLASARQGDKEAYRVLVVTYQDRIFNLVMSMVHRRELAEDLTQEIFVKAYFALQNFKQDSGFYTWIYRIASNHCLDALRKKRVQEVSLDDAGREDAEHLSRLDAMLAPAAEQPGSALESEGEQSELLDLLPAEHRLILVLRELEGYRYDELASILKCPLNTVKSRLNRAREALKELFVTKYGPIPHYAASGGNIPARESVEENGESHDHP